MILIGFQQISGFWIKKVKKDRMKINQSIFLFYLFPLSLNQLFSEIRFIQREAVDFSEIIME